MRPFLKVPRYIPVCTFAVQRSGTEVLVAREMHQPGITSLLKSEGLGTRNRLAVKFAL